VGSGQISGRDRCWQLRHWLTFRLVGLRFWTVRGFFGFLVTVLSPKTTAGTPLFWKVPACGVGLTGFEPATPCPPALINSLLSLGFSISARNGARYDGPEGLIDNQLRDRTVRSMNDAQSIADVELWTTSDIAFYWRCGRKLAASRLSCVGAPSAIVFEGSRNKLWVSKEIRSWTLTKRKFPSRVAGSAFFEAPLPRRRGPQIGRV